MTTDDEYIKAKRRVEAKLGFYIHLGVYVVVNVLLVLINLSTSSQYLWFPWPLFGWGIGVTFHGLGVFVLSEGSNVKQRLIERELHKQPKK